MEFWGHQSSRKIQFLQSFEEEVKVEKKLFKKFYSEPTSSKENPIMEDLRIKICIWSFRQVKVDVGRKQELSQFFVDKLKDMIGSCKPSRFWVNFFIFWIGLDFSNFSVRFCNNSKNKFSNKEDTDR